MLSLLVWKRSHLSVALLLFWALLNGSFVATFPWMNYPHIVRYFPKWNPLLVDMIMERNGIWSMYCLAMVSVMACVVKRREVYIVGVAFSYMCFINSLYVIFQSLMLPHFLVAWPETNPMLYSKILENSSILRLNPFYCGGFLGNASINSTFIACTIPLFAFNETKKDIDNLLSTIGGAVAFIFVAMIPLLAVVLSGSSMGVGVAIVAIVSYLISLKTSYMTNTTIKITSIIVVSCIGLTISYLTFGENLFDASGRFYILPIGWDWLMTYGSWALGEGQGASQLIVPLIQKLSGPPRSYFYFFHNDWFQIFFELGIVGIFFSGLVGVCALIKSYSRPWLFSAVCAYGTAMLGNFPLHVASFAVLGVFLILRAFRYD